MAWQELCPGTADSFRSTCCPRRKIPAVWYSDVFGRSALLMKRNRTFGQTMLPTLCRQGLFPANIRQSYHSHSFLAGCTWVVKIALKKWTPRLGDLGDTGQWRNIWPPKALPSLGESCDDPGVEYWRPCSEGGDLKVSKGLLGQHLCGGQAG